MKWFAVLPTMRRLPVQWLLEVVLLVLGVTLGFWVTQLQEARKDRELAARVLDGVLAEMEHNRGVLEPFVPMHERWAEALNTAETSARTESGVDVLFATRPPIPAGSRSPFPFLRRSAWDVAVAGGALRLIDYDAAAALSDVYRVQEIATENVERLARGVLASPAPFDPGSRAASVRLLWLTIADIASAEAILLDLYGRHLPAIRAAARGSR